MMIQLSFHLRLKREKKYKGREEICRYTKQKYEKIYGNILRAANCRREHASQPGRYERGNGKMDGMG